MEFKIRNPTNFLKRKKTNKALVDRIVKLSSSLDDNSDTIFFLYITMPPFSC
jgi:hypothetical protein